MTPHSRLVPALVALSFLLQISAPAQNLPANTNRSSARNLKSFIAGGSANRILSNSLTSFIGGGSFNRIAPYVAGGFIGGGVDNSISALSNASASEPTSGSVIGGGIYNAVTGSATTIGGGGTNTAQGTAVTIAGGDNNNALSDSSFIGGGSFNRILNNASTSVIGGGSYNVITNTNNVPDPLGARGSVIAGGIGNRIAASDFIDPAGPGVLPPTVLRPATATVGGGLANKADGAQSTVGGGFSNAVAGTWATVAGGRENKATELFATVSGGHNNATTATNATVSGGKANTNAGGAGFIGGGVSNQITGGGSWATICGGGANTNSGPAAIISGGVLNRILVDASYATIAGGFKNTNSGPYATVSGGSNNIASGLYSTIPGGTKCEATHKGSFVWSGDDTVTTSSIAEKSFTVRAPGGVVFNTTSFPLSGPNMAAYLAPNTSSWATISDSNAKTKVTAINPREILSKVAAMPVTQWEYKADPERRRYIGPMSQDFHAAFGLGYDDKTISTIDSDGVMYAAIQGLVEELKERDKAMAARDETIEGLKSKLQAIEERFNSLPPAP